MKFSWEHICVWRITSNLCRKRPRKPRELYRLKFTKHTMIPNNFQIGLFYFKPFILCRILKWNLQICHKVIFWKFLLIMLLEKSNLQIVAIQICISISTLTGCHWTPALMYQMEVDQQKQYSLRLSHHHRCWTLEVYLFWDKILSFRKVRVNSIWLLHIFWTVLWVMCLWLTDAEL